jgi:hypothetical protein
MKKMSNPNPMFIQALNITMAVEIVSVKNVFMGAAYKVLSRG